MKSLICDRNVPSLINKILQYSIKFFRNVISLLFGADYVTYACQCPVLVITFVLHNCPKHLLCFVFCVWYYFLTVPYSPL